MIRKFTLIRSKVRPSIRIKFIGTIGQGYTIKAPTSDDTFYTVLTSPNKMLVM